MQENAFESVVLKMVAILSRPQCINTLPLVDPLACVIMHWAVLFFFFLMLLVSSSRLEFLIASELNGCPLIFLYHHWGYLNNPIFLNMGLCAACWAHFMCHHELWPTSVSHTFSSLNSSLDLAAGKHYPKITIPIFRLVLQNFAIPDCFPYILFHHYHFSLLSSGWFVIALCGSVSVRKLVKY